MNLYLSKTLCLLIWLFFSIIYLTSCSNQNLIHQQSSSHRLNGILTNNSQSIHLFKFYDGEPYIIQFSKNEDQTDLDLENEQIDDDSLFKGLNIENHNFAFYDKNQEVVRFSQLQIASIKNKLDQLITIETSDGLPLDLHSIKQLNTEYYTNNRLLDYFDLSYQTTASFQKNNVVIRAIASLVFGHISQRAVGFKIENNFISFFGKLPSGKFLNTKIAILGGLIFFGIASIHAIYQKINFNNTAITSYKNNLKDAFDDQIHPVDYPPLFLRSKADTKTKLKTLYLMQLIQFLGVIINDYSLHQSHITSFCFPSAANDSDCYKLYHKITIDDLS